MTLIPMAEHHARQFAAWYYEPPYDCYNCPSWEEMTARGWGLTTDEGRGQMQAAVSQLGELLGYLRASPAEIGVKLGIGLSPEHCGRGLGAQALALFFEQLKRNDIFAVSLEVRSFNRRAIRTYERMGFVSGGPFLRDGVEYIPMTGHL